MLNEIRTLNYN